MADKELYLTARFTSLWMAGRNETNMNKTNGNTKIKVRAKTPPLLIHETDNLLYLKK